MQMRMREILFTKGRYNLNTLEKIIEKTNARITEIKKHGGDLSDKEYTEIVGDILTAAIHTDRKLRAEREKMLADFKEADKTLSDLFYNIGHGEGEPPTCESFIRK